MCGALKLLRATPSVSLLLSNIMMPNTNGYELVEAPLKMRPEQKVLMMTAYPIDRPPTSALKAREIRTLIKPFDPTGCVRWWWTCWPGPKPALPDPA
jgi:CheY-like chemotaxis protein